MKFWRPIVVILGGLALIALCVPLVLAARAEGLAMKSVKQVFQKPLMGHFQAVEARGLITEKAVEGLRTVGDKTGSFRLRSASILACQASGAPCIVIADLDQKQRTYRFRLDIYWGTIVFADLWP
jgi:hypothetical protein